MIKARLLAIYLIAVCPMVRGSNTDTRSDSIDIIHTNLAIDVSNFSKRIMYGHADISFVPKVNNVNYIKLDLLELKVDSVKSGSSPLKYTYDDSVIAISLSDSVVTGRQQTISVFYHGTPFRCRAISEDFIGMTFMLSILVSVFWQSRITMARSGFPVLIISWSEALFILLSLLILPGGHFATDIRIA